MIKLNLIFKNHYDKERIIASPKNREEVFENIHAFVDECNKNRIDGKEFNIYYSNIYMLDSRLKIDIGSYTEFFYCELTENETWESVGFSNFEKEKLYE